MAEYKLEHTDKPDKKREELKGKVLQLKDLVNYNDGHGCKPDDYLAQGGKYHHLLV